ncbi:MAG TPA: sugar phosphate isomerase/epimerase family protein [Trebonia sp.]|nr:sugar phosphate isomerase/epimerase family protein [Trebonia sp.]
MPCQRRQGPSLPPARPASEEAPISTPRIAFSTLAFPDADLATAVSLGRTWGYAGVELRLIDGELIDPAMPAAARALVKRTLASAGLPAVAVDSSIRLTGERPAAELRRFLELASDWEAPLVRVFGGALPGDGPGRRARLEAAMRVLEEAAPAAERLGVAIGVETHDAFSASAVVAELLALVDSAAVGAVWDSHHPHRMGEAAADVWANLGPRILLAQVKDARPDPGRDDGWQLVLLGDGEVPVRDMLGLLSAGGYRGWVSVEWEKRWHPEIAAPEVALPQHLAMLRSWVEEGG